MYREGSLDGTTSLTMSPTKTLDKSENPYEVWALCKLYRHVFFILNKCFFIDQERGLCPAINRMGEEGEGLPSLKLEVRHSVKSSA